MQKLITIARQYNDGLLSIEEFRDRIALGISELQTKDDIHELLGLLLRAK